MGWETTRPLGATGFAVSGICIGGASWAGDDARDDAGGGLSEPAAVDLAIAVFDDPRLNFLDTSNNYGNSEERIGRAIAEYGGLPEGFLLQTKADRNMDTGDFSGDQVRRSLEQSLDRLGLDHLPMVYLHDPEYGRWEQIIGEGGAVEALVEARDSGLIAHLGVSGGLSPVLSQLVDLDVFEVLITHNRYTIVDRSADELISHARSKGLGILDAAPYGGGILAGWPRTSSSYGYRPAPPSLLTAVDTLGALCLRHGIPLAALALQFTRRDPRIDAPIVGVVTREELATTLELAEVEIPEEIWSTVEEVLPPREDWIDSI